MSERLHPFHTSIGDCHYNPKTQHLELSIRFFTDDLEQALGTFNKAPITLSTSRIAEPILQQYLSKHIKVSEQDKGAIILTIIGKEAANDVTWVYIESGVCSTNQLTFRQSALTDQFPDQSNLINFDGFGLKRTLLFDTKTPEKVL